MRLRHTVGSTIASWVTPELSFLRGECGGRICPPLMGSMGKPGQGTHGRRGRKSGGVGGLVSVLFSSSCLPFYFSPSVAFSFSLPSLFIPLPALLGPKVCTHTQMHTCIHNTYICHTHVHTFVCAHTHRHTCIHMHTRVYTCTYLHTRTCMCTHAHLYTHICIHAHMHNTPLHMHTHLEAAASSLSCAHSCFQSSFLKR